MVCITVRLSIVMAHVTLSYLLWVQVYIEGPASLDEWVYNKPVIVPPEHCMGFIV